MAIGLVGRKVGMTRVFDDGGSSTPVTVLEVTPNRVSQVRNVEADGYTAVQMTAGNRRPGRVTKAMAGHFAKAGIEPGRTVSEFAAIFSTPSSRLTLTRGCLFIVNSPIGPFATIVSSLIVTSVPPGNVTGFLAIRDIMHLLLSDVTDHFATNPSLAGIAIGHDTF